MVKANDHRRMALMRPLLGASALVLLGACQPQKELFPGMEAPTQIQSDAMGWPAPQQMNLDEGDNQDPSFDSPGYPYGSQPWYAQPGYLQG